MNLFPMSKPYSDQVKNLAIITTQWTLTSMHSSSKSISFQICC